MRKYNMNNSLKVGDVIRFGEDKGNRNHINSLRYVSKHATKELYYLMELKNGKANYFANSLEEIEKAFAGTYTIIQRTIEEKEIELPERSPPYKYLITKPHQLTPVGVFSCS